MGGELDKARRAASQDRNPDAYVVRLRDLRVALAEVDRLHTVIGNHARALGEATSDLAALRIEHAAWGALLDATRADRDAARAEVATLRAEVTADKVRTDAIETERMWSVSAFHRARQERDEARDEVTALRAQVADLQRLGASIHKAADAARKAERDRCADIVNGWHISKGGYTELAYVLRTAPK